MRTCSLDVHKDMVFCAIHGGEDSVEKKFDTLLTTHSVKAEYL